MRLQAQHQAEYERGSERLLEAVTKACAAQPDFAAKVRSALEGGLTLLSTEPALVRLLSIRSDPQDQALAQLQVFWRERYADLLRRAARFSSEASTHPIFVEPILMGGIRWQIAAWVTAGRTAQLPELAPALTRYVLCYYLPPQLASSVAVADDA